MARTKSGTYVHKGKISREAPVTPRSVGPVNKRRETGRPYAGRAPRGSNKHYITGYDYQCPTCGRVFHGPDEGLIRGTKLAHGTHGEKVVEEACPSCRKK